MLERVKQADFIHQPSVKIKIVKNKVAVKSIEMKQTAAIPQKQEALLVRSAASAAACIESNIQTEVVLKDTQETPAAHDQPCSLEEQV